MRVRLCRTRHHVLREVLGYQASTDRKLLMEAERDKLVNYSHYEIYLLNYIRNCE